MQVANLTQLNLHRLIPSHLILLMITTITPEGYDVRNRIEAHFNTLSSRPDYDGIVTDAEARAWW